MVDSLLCYSPIKYLRSRLLSFCLWLICGGLSVIISSMLLLRYHFLARIEQVTDPEWNISLRAFGFVGEGFPIAEQPRQHLHEEQQSECGP